MNYETRELDQVNLKAVFVSASLGKIGNALISYSASIKGKRLLAEIVVHKSITEEEEEDIYEILGHIVGQFPESSADFDLIKVDNECETSISELFPIKLFRKRG